MKTSNATDLLKRKTYFTRIPGAPGDSKVQAVESTLSLDGECSQTVEIGKSFDYDYWPNLCPFQYTAELRDTIIASALRQKLGNDYTKYAIDDPQIEDYGWFMALRFRLRDASQEKQAQFAMDVDRCESKVIEVWEVPANVADGTN
jgi:hypothetical protein